LFSDLFDDVAQLSENEKIPPLAQDNDIPSNFKKIGSDDPFFEFDEFKSNEKSKDEYRSKANKNNSELDSFFKPSNIKTTTEPASEIINNNSVEANVSQKSSGGIPDDWNLSEKEDSFDDLLTGIGEPLINKDGNEDSFEEDVFVPSIDDSNRIKTNEQSNFSESSKVNTAFFKGLGVSDEKLIEGFSEKRLFLAGKLLRSALIGTMEVLQSRAEIKNEMRMDMTTIQPIQNNPIKFSIDVDETIKKLLLQDNKSYMEPERAMQEAYDDITSHQLAIISGIQASLSHVLKRFEPENLISRLEENNPISASIPIHRKAKLWEAFEILYDQIEIEAEDDFNRLFGQEFARAYDEQVEILKKKRSN